ncbi:DnaJ-domain-containing protein [Leucogyrophana mollusca]|uniref:DnaJ-domain-containing protein n=1 Tax=Leucogyrophana mollusca TaxID=85980 RepID=A0ACB8BS15_9AGAM|nr:DnaJ-domain-containing protein [Leucogyrophana mollusca]
MYSASCLLILALTLAVLVNAADLYKTLELSRHASDQDIRKAYKRLSRKYHPDKNKDPGAEEKFVEIAHAYEVLSDQEKRQIYDRHGEEGLRAHEGGQGFHANPFDMFSSFFGGGFAAQQQTRRGPTVIMDFEVSLADMYKGSSIDFMMKKNVLCDHCRGTGAASDGDIHACSGCGGSGVKIVKQQIFPGMFAQSQQTCNECGGRGRVIVKKCPHCGGGKVVDHTGHHTLEVEPGMPEGYEVIFEGAGDESPDWEAGDVILRVRSAKEEGGWRRKESSLYWKETIGVAEALLGFQRNITHLDGHVIEVDRKGVTQPGFVQTIDGEGMPHFQQSTHGDLYIEYNVVFPVELSPEMRRKLAEAFYGPAHHGRDEL